MQKIPTKKQVYAFDNIRKYIYNNIIKINKVILAKKAGIKPA